MSEKKPKLVIGTERPKQENEKKEEVNEIPNVRKLTNDDKKEGQPVIIVPSPTIRCYFEDKVQEGVFGTIVKGNDEKMYIRAMVVLVAELDEIEKYESLLVFIDENEKE